VSELLSLITTPIDGDNPCGRTINYEPEFDRIKAEIGRIGSSDFDAIEQAAVTILKSKSKDIRVLSFLAFVYLRNENWEKLADVFEGFAILSGQDFDAMFPERSRAKEMAVSPIYSQTFRRT
jgi:type VI secretion system protein VasJ